MIPCGSCLSSCSNSLSTDECGKGGGPYDSLVPQCQGCLWALLHTAQTQTLGLQSCHRDPLCWSHCCGVPTCRSVGHSEAAFVFQTPAPLWLSLASRLRICHRDTSNGQDNRWSDCVSPTSLSKQEKMELPAGFGVIA